MVTPHSVPFSPSARRVLAGAGVCLVATLALALPASAHVSVSADSAVQGGYSKLTFRVPTEKEGVATTKVVVQLPQNTPFGYVALEPHPGWTATVTEAKLATPITTDDGTVTKAASTITWAATSRAAGIQTGEFDEFEVAVGPLPDVADLSFKTLQTYSDGETVRWIEQASAGAAEPDHPAPTLAIAPAATPAGAATSDGGAATASDTSKASNSSSTGALVVAAIALVVGLVGLGTAVLALRANSRRTFTPPIRAPRDYAPVK